MAADILLLVGLGNPGAKYARHRHNVGFMAVDAIADAHNFGPAKAKFRGEIREGSLDGPGGRRRAIVLKPQTYMNESGRSVQEAARFYKIEPADIVVFHDELDLAAGKVKVKAGGGNAGHNGLKSIDAHVGNDFRRVRIGIGHPGDKSRVTGHVLGDFTRADSDWLDPLLAAMGDAAPMLADSDARFMSDIALRLSPAKAPRPAPAAPASPAPAARPAKDKPRAPEKSGNALADALQKLFNRKD